MEFASISSPAAALVAGLITSVHCAGMCGPIACSVMPVKPGQGDPSTAAVSYHIARIGGYSVLGAIGGGLGRMPLLWISASNLKWLPWLGVIFFVGLALRWDRQIPKIPAFGKLAFHISSQVRSRPRYQAAAALGLATPLFPCGPLYFLLALSLVAGSAARGAEFMLAFGLGTLPLLWFIQTQLGLARRLLSPRATEHLRLALALSAAALTAWRLRGTLGFAGPDPASFICF